MEVSKCLSLCLLLWNLIISLLKGVEASHRVFPEYQFLAATTVKQLHRTVYHFQPPKHWINDPNGPMYYNGFYHLFYQYNPKGSVWGNIVWAHSVSKDLVNWEPLEPAIYPSKPFDIKGTWSGSATIFPGDKVVIYYTGIDAKEKQLQNYAVPENPSDPYLRKWKKPKEGNPMVVPDNEINGSSFRDPTTAWQANGYWHILVGSRKNDVGVAYLFKSKDQKTWVKTPVPLHQVPGTGNWECPDFYPVSISGKTGLDTSELGNDVKHVLKVSLDATRYDYYTIGTYFPDQDKYVPDKGQADGWDGLRLDYGNFYASKSFFDPVKHRRIVWGWSNESDTKQDDVKKGWAGIQLIPRTVLLDPSGKQLVQWPVEEIETLRGQMIHKSNHKLETGKPVKLSQGITGAQADVVVTFSIPNLDKAEPFDPSWKDPQDLCFKKKSVQGAIGPFGLMVLATEKLEEFTPVFFRIFKAKDNKPVVLMCSDEEHSTLKTDVYKPMYGGFVDVDLADKKLSLRSLIDHSVVESFAAGGKTIISNRVYPTVAVFEMAHVFAFNNGTEPITLERALLCL
ncbi:beta-fructofuranosidase, insoluble isoenzyme 3-like [Hibiscus syriacus]|uniref:beta-fructofuranosidase, insoluble isoenzyme 3-like n=1 Tax=Hibiscus syriacus TaxID=106335 RepID=UPI001923256B|nr:beta-fructofuranosidase, insoluble isoenzyme 3-like [Hibiscus syriacus]